MLIGSGQIGVLQVHLAALVELALSGAVELGVHRVHVPRHILPGKEAKHVPSKDFVLKCAPADFETFCRLCKRRQFHNKVEVFGRKISQ